MNTVICDAESSELADLIGPLVLDYCQKRIGWSLATYQNRAIRRSPTDIDLWCLSELLFAWNQSLGRNEMLDRFELHEACPWQDP